MVSATQALVGIMESIPPGRKNRLSLHVAAAQEYTYLFYMRAILKCLAPCMFEIRQSKKLKIPVSLLAPLPSPQTLTFQLLKKDWDVIQQAVQSSSNLQPLTSQLLKKDWDVIQQAVHSSSSLKHLHVHAVSQSAAAHAMKLLVFRAATTHTFEDIC